MVGAASDVDLDCVRIDDAVASRQPRDDRGILLLAVDSDVDSFVVVYDAHCGALARWLALVGNVLGEVVRGRRILPGGLVEPPVEAYARAGAHRNHPRTLGLQSGR